MCTAASTGLSTPNKHTNDTRPDERAKPCSMLELIRKSEKPDFNSFLEEACEAFNDSTVSEIERLTLSQSASDDWHSYRKGIATSTICHMFKTKAHKLKSEPRPHDLSALMKAVLKSSKFQTKAMKEGSEKESEARRRYISVMNADGHTVVVRQSGFVVSKEFPVVGCSPDGIVNFECACCTGKRSMLEIKCPQKVSNALSKENPKPAYFTQIQVQMGVLGIGSCDFFVYECEDVWKLLHIAFQKEYFEQCLSSVRLIYSEYLYNALRAF